MLRSRLLAAAREEAAADGQRPAAQPGPHRRPQRAGPHLQLPGEPDLRPPRRLQGAQPRPGPRRRPRRGDRRAHRRRTPPSCWRPAPERPRTLLADAARAARRGRRRVAPGGRRAAARPRRSACPRGRLLTLDDVAGRRRRAGSPRCVDQRADRVPLQHLTGRRAVPARSSSRSGPGVFVPRPETELLARWALDAVRRRSTGRWSSTSAAGSGAIALSIAHEHPGARVTAVERDPGALDWTRHNAAARAAAGDTPVGVLAGDMTDAGLLPELDGARRPGGLQPALRARRRPACRARSPTTTRRWRCGAAPTASTSSAGMLRTAARLLRPGGWLGIEHADQQGTALPAAGPARTAAGPTSRTTPTWPAAPASPPPAAPADAWGDCCPVADLYDCTDPDARAAGLDAAAAAIGRGRAGAAADRHRLRRRRRRVHAAAVTGLLAAKNRGRAHAGPGAHRRGVHAGRAGGAPARRPRTSSAQAFWPGGLTLVLEHAPSLAWDLGDAEGTVAVRLPDDDLARDLLRRTGPLAVSSANRSGRPAATTAQEAVEQLGEHAAVVLDGGPRSRLRGQHDRRLHRPRATRPARRRHPVTGCARSSRAHRLSRRGATRSVPLERYRGVTAVPRGDAAARRRAAADEHACSPARPEPDRAG